MIGAGVIGACTTRFLAKKGVLLVERGGIQAIGFTQLVPNGWSASLARPRRMAGGTPLASSFGGNRV